MYFERSEGEGSGRPSLGDMLFPAMVVEIVVAGRYQYRALKRLPANAANVFGVGRSCGPDRRIQVFPPLVNQGLDSLDVPLGINTTGQRDQSKLALGALMPQPSQRHRFLLKVAPIHKQPVAREAQGVDVDVQSWKGGSGHRIFHEAQAQPHV